MKISKIDGIATKGLPARKLATTGVILKPLRKNVNRGKAIIIEMPKKELPKTVEMDKTVKTSSTKERNMYACGNWSDWCGGGFDVCGAYS